MRPRVSGRQDGRNAERRRLDTFQGRLHGAAQGRTGQHCGWGTTALDTFGRADPCSRAGAGFRGKATPPDPNAAAALRARLAAADQTARAASEFLYGWRTPFAFEIPPYPVPPNAMDVFVDAARSDDSSWLPSAPLAARAANRPA